jgi:hypothetical protein
LQILDTILDATIERGLTNVTRLALNASESNPAAFTRSNTLAAILACNSRLTALSFSGMPLEDEALPLLAEAVQIAGRISAD